MIRLHMECLASFLSNIWFSLFRSRLYLLGHASSGIPVEVQKLNRKRRFELFWLKE